jgi:hypothetical protein
MRGVIYAVLASTAFAVLNGSTERQSTQQRDYAITIMSHRDGRWLIGLIGFIILAVGIAQVRERIKLTFLMKCGSGSVILGGLARLHAVSYLLLPDFWSSPQHGPRMQPEQRAWMAQ